MVLTQKGGLGVNVTAFFDSQRKKSMVVVIVAKNVWEPGVEATHLNFIRHYFTERGYNRIVIQQARSMGRPTHSDTIVRENSSTSRGRRPGL